MDAGLGIDGFMADRAAGSGGDRGVDVLGIHGAHPGLRRGPRPMTSPIVPVLGTRRTGGIEGPAIGPLEPG
jgi:hypothetical protein